MTRNAVRNYLVLGCLVSLSLCHLLWPSEASQPAVAVDSKILDAFVARNIGPANMGGRIVDIAGVDSDPKTVYVAAASGGLWKTTDTGETWTGLFDKETSVCIGSVAVSQSNPNIVWVGTGEHNPRNSVAWGDGVYKSTDGGKSWQHMGLKDSHTTGRIAIHPTNPDIVYVAVLGHLWGPNSERGIYKTTDGGKTWQVSKFIDENTGFIDLKMDPADPNILYGAAYCCRRDAFSGGNPKTVIGPGAGLYKTTDGGKTWEKMANGLPTNQYGRCGIDIYRKDPNVVFAIVQTEKTPSGNANEGGQPNGKTGPDVGGLFRSNDKGKTWEFINSIVPRPMYFGQVIVDPSDDNHLFVFGVNMFVSTDGGKTFPGGGKGGKGGGAAGGGGAVPAKGGDPQKKGDETKKDTKKADETKKDETPKKVDPQKAGGQKGGGGKGGGLHSDQHATWFNPKNSKEVWVGNDGGFYLSKDGGKTYKAIRAAALGQFYGISVDMSKPYYVYGGLQDNGSHGGPSATHDETGIRLTHWFNIRGADGFHTQSDWTDSSIVYAESQYGSPGRVDVTNKGKGGGGKGGGGGGGGKGGMSVKGLASRFNWSSPMLLSPHDAATFYYGGNVLLKSTEHGANMKKISPDLTWGEDKKKDGTGAHTLFTIGESPKKRGVLWTGADDGRIHVSKNAGEKWTDVSQIPNMPTERCVSRVEPSHFDDGTCYVSITRYRNDDRKPYIFKTTNYGETWENVTGNLPESGSVHVVIESSRNKNVLFCGTEFGVFVSLDGAKSWQRFKAGLPTVAVHDLDHPSARP